MHFVLNTEMKYNFFKNKKSVLLHADILVSVAPKASILSWSVTCFTKNEKWSSFLLPALHKGSLTTALFWHHLHGHTDRWSWVLQRVAKWSAGTTLSSQYVAQGSIGCICPQWQYWCDKKKARVGTVCVCIHSQL